MDEHLIKITFDPTVSIKERICFISQSLVKELENFPVNKKTNGYRGVFLQEVTKTTVTYLIRCGQVREQNESEEATNTQHHKRPEYVRKKIAETIRHRAQMKKEGVDGIK